MTASRLKVPTRRQVSREPATLRRCWRGAAMRLKPITAEQRHRRAGVQQHQPDVHVLEGRGVRGALGQREERGQHDEHADGDQERHGVALHDASTHSYQSLVRSQPLNSEAMSCRGPGKLLMSSTARMRTL